MSSMSPEGIFLNMGFYPNTVFSSNRALIGSHHKSIKYSSNESTVYLKLRVFDENFGVGFKNPCLGMSPWETFLCLIKV